MPVPVDPGAFTIGATGSADAVDARFAALYAALGAGVDAGLSVRDHGLTLREIEVEAWSTVLAGLYNGGWDPDFDYLPIYKDSIGIVRVLPIGSTLLTGTVSPGTDICGLNAGYRPGVKSYFPLQTLNGIGDWVLGAVSIATDGLMVVEQQTLQYGAYFNIEFRAEG